MKLSFAPDILLEAIRVIEEHKRKAVLLPDYALLVELRERFPNVGRFIIKRSYGKKRT